SRGGARSPRASRSSTKRSRPRPRTQVYLTSPLKTDRPSQRDMPPSTQAPALRQPTRFRRFADPLNVTDPPDNPTNREPKRHVYASSGPVFVTSQALPERSDYSDH